MSDKSIVHGQLYRVGITGRTANEKIEEEIVFVATSSEDVRARFPWVYDLSGFVWYRIDWIAKEPGRHLSLRIKTEPIDPADPDANIERQDGTQAVFQRVYVESTGTRYECVARSILYAKDAAHAKKKLASRIDSGSESVSYAIDALPASSPYAAPRDVSVFKRAHFVRG